MPFFWYIPALCPCSLESLPTPSQSLPILPSPKPTLPARPLGSLQLGVLLSSYVAFLTPELPPGFLGIYLQGSPLQTDSLSHPRPHLSPALLQLCICARLTTS